MLDSANRNRTTKNCLKGPPIAHSIGIQAKHKYVQGDHPTSYLCYHISKHTYLNT